MRGLTFFKDRRASSALRWCHLPKATLASGRVNLAVIGDDVSVRRCIFSLR